MERITNMFLVKLEGHKASCVPQWKAAVESNMATKGISFGDLGMLSFYFHLDDAELIQRHPFAVRLEAPDRPIMPIDGDPAARWLFDRQKENFDLYVKLYMEIIQDILSTLDEGDIKKLAAINPILGLRNVSPSDIWRWVTSEYGVLSKDELNAQEEMVKRPLSASQDLASNFNDMIVANNILISRNCGFSNRLMFKYAFEKTLNNVRTRKIAEDYESRVDFVIETADFEDFVKFVKKQYAQRTKPEGTSAFAFVGDSDRQPTIGTRPFNTTDDTRVGGAAQKMVTISEAEYKKLKNPVENQRGKRELRLATSYCFLHGHCGHGPSVNKFCKKMSSPDGTPIDGYIKDQVMCTSPDGPNINGVPRSKKIAFGFRLN